MDEVSTMAVGSFSKEKNLNHHTHLHGRKLVVRSSASGELDGSDAETPDVGLEVVTLHLLHHFRRHPAWRAHERVTRVLASQILAGRQPRAHSEVCKRIGKYGTFDLANY